jgi:hypothetical protein
MRSSAQREWWTWPGSLFSGGWSILPTRWWWPKDERIRRFLLAARFFLLFFPIVEAPPVMSGLIFGGTNDGAQLLNLQGRAAIQSTLARKVPNLAGRVDAPPQSLSIIFTYIILLPMRFQ